MGNGGAREKTSAFIICNPCKDMSSINPLHVGSFYYGVLMQFTQTHVAEEQAEPKCQYALNKVPSSCGLEHLEDLLLDNR